MAINQDWHDRVYHPHMLANLEAAMWAYDTSARVEYDMGKLKQLYEGPMSKPKSNKKLLLLENI